MVAHVDRRRVQRLVHAGRPVEQLTGEIAADAPGVSGQVCNIACGSRISLLELIAWINDILGTALAPEHDAPRAGDVRHSLADISRAQQLLGYQPEVDVRAGLRRYIDWFVRQERKKTRKLARVAV